MTQTACAGPSRSRPPWLRASAAAATALLVVACGGGSHPTESSTSSAELGVVDSFASCLRSHGLPNVYVSRTPGTANPDTIMVDGGYAVQGASQSAPHLVSAMNACLHLLPAVPTSTGADARQQFRRALEAVACMRAHRYPDFPDPSLQGGGPFTLRAGALFWPPLPADIDASSLAFQAAEKACGPAIPPGLGPQP